MVLAPEHPLVDRITTPQQRETVDAYRQATSRQTEITDNILINISLHPGGFLGPGNP